MGQEGHMWSQAKKKNDKIKRNPVICKSVKCFKHTHTHIHTHIYIYTHTHIQTFYVIQGVLTI